MYRQILLGVCIALLANLIACKKSEPEAPAAGADPASQTAAPAPVPGQDVLPGASEIRAAMASKNYEQAVGSLIAVQGALVTPEQRSEFAVLFQEVREALQDASPTNPKAAEALATLRAVRSGR